MTSKINGAKHIATILLLVLAILAIGGSITFARFYGEVKDDSTQVKIADAVASIDVNAVYRTDSNGNKISIPFDKNADTVMLYDVEPQDEISYYFTLSGVEGRRNNEVTMNVTLSVTVRLETIATDGSGKHVDYFGGWTTYTDGIKDGGYLRLYSGGENESTADIKQSADQSTTINYQAHNLVIETVGDTITNKTGLVMAADDVRKVYPYQIHFALPRQNTDKDNYAGARVYFEIKAVAEQANPGATK